MSKKNAKIAPTEDVAADEGSEVKAATPRTRGPRGVAEDARITLHAQANPKRPNTKAFAKFTNYVDGMTVKEFADAVGDGATSTLVYDAKHGFISIDGYDPGTIIVAKVKEPKAPKEPKPKREKKVKVVDTEAADETAAESMD